MTRTTVSTAADTEEHRGLRANALGVPALVLTLAATIGLVAAFIGATPLVFIMAGAGAPGVYLIATAAYCVFAGGYLAMARKFGSASGFVAFIAHGFGRRAGVAAAYITLLTYPLFLAALYGIFTMFVQQALLAHFGVDVNWVLIAALTVVVATLMSYARIEVSVRFLGAVLVIGILLVLGLDAAVVTSAAAGEGGGITFESFGPAAVFGPALGLALLFALGSYGGIESVAVYSEEVKDQRRTVTRSLYLAIAVIGAFYVLSTWVVVLGVGGEVVGEVAAEDPGGFIFALTAQTLGGVWAEILNVIVIVSFTGILIGFTNISSRYQFALGRAGLLPARIGTAHPKHQSPHVGVLSTGAVSLILILAFGLSGGQPYEHLYTWLIALATVGSLVLIVLSSAATLVYHLRNRHDENAWNAYYAPALSTVGFGLAVWLSVTNYELLAGETAAAQWLWLLVPAVGVVGLGVGGRKRYEQMSFENVG
jgi:amino acid transporter